MVYDKGIPLSVYSTYLRAMLVCLACLLLCSPALSDDLLTVRMKGSAEGVGLSARKAAIENACQLVVEEVLQAMTSISDMALFKSILGQASRYIPQYDLLRSDSFDTTTVVEIDAHLLETPLKRDAAAIMLPRLPRKPTVRLLLAEYIGSEAASGGPTFDIAASALRKTMEEYGFIVKDLLDLLDHYEIDELVAITQGDVPTTAAFARANKEDVIIVGSVTTSHEALRQETNMYRNRARAVLRVISGPDGKICDTLTAEAAVQSVDPVEGGVQAAQDACGKLVGDSVVAIVLSMLSMEDETRVIVQIERPGSEKLFQEFVDTLNGLDCIRGVEQLFYSDTLARIALEYYGDMAFINDMLSGITLGKYKVEVSRCVRREITLLFR